MSKTENHYRITACEIVRVRTSVHRALTSYRDDMPKPELFSAELRRWRKPYIVMPADKIPSSPAQAIKECDEDMCASQNYMHASSNVLRVRANRQCFCVA